MKTAIDSTAQDTTGLPDRRKGELFLKEKAMRKYYERETEIQKAKADSLAKIAEGHKAVIKQYRGVNEDLKEQVKDSEALTAQEREDKESCEEEVYQKTIDLEKTKKKKGVFKTLAICGGAVVVVETFVIWLLVRH